MPRSLVLASKFLSVAGLGLLSSSALTLSLATLPSLLAIPSPTDALPAFWRLKQHVAAAHRILAVSTGTLLTSAYILSPRFARHPFLIYMGLTVGIGSFGIPKLLKTQDLSSLDEVELAEEGRGRMAAGAGAGTGAGAGAELRINGEVIRERMESWREALKWQSVAWGIGWAMGTVGLWGDGY